MMTLCQYRNYKLIEKEDSLMMFIMMITNIIFNFQSQVTVFPSSTKSEMTFPTEPARRPGNDAFKITNIIFNSQSQVTP